MLINTTTICTYYYFFFIVGLSPFRLLAEDRGQDSTLKCHIHLHCQILSDIISASWPKCFRTRRRQTDDKRLGCSSCNSLSTGYVSAMCVPSYGVVNIPCPALLWLPWVLFIQ